eukprot:CAMPEP_0170813886 /NCGR_PEP_ID=MMETSP0733-20121128/37216_1 /TAXON_ID=186038 /ORGANISM="Fragilariopsis kerguelensis, Strain L26-C5" /LENGTH=75 /DNA_ID=CAMNT_0011171511 /DNA_START=95 /DNA_END=322 /DNA_ORIENTATION=-
MSSHRSFFGVIDFDLVLERSSSSPHFGTTTSPALPRTVFFKVRQHGNGRKGRHQIIPIRTPSMTPILILDTIDQQ